MKLSPEQNAAINAAIEREIRVQDKLAQAREAAADALINYFESDDLAIDDSKCPDRIKVAIQFTARSFQPLQVIMRAAARAEEPNHDDPSPAEHHTDPTPVVAQHHPAPVRGKKYHEPARKRKARLRAESNAGRKR